MTAFWPKFYKRTKDMRDFLMQCSDFFPKKQTFTPIPNKLNKHAKFQQKKILKLTCRNKKMRKKRKEILKKRESKTSSNNRRLNNSKCKKSLRSKRKFKRRFQRRINLKRKKKATNCCRIKGTVLRLIHTTGLKLWRS